jgi:hypothetical protein
MGPLAWIPVREEYLKLRFPGLRDGAFQITSPETGTYNCLAWAGGDDSRVWLPDASGLFYWPGEPWEDTLQGWIDGFGHLGYVRCENGDVEDGYEKLVIYGTDNYPRHMARQLPSGLWTSKLGKSEDIAHELEGVSGEAYGTVLAYLRRERAG